MTKMKRTISFLLTLVLLLSCVAAYAPEASAYAPPKPLPALTGNKGQDVANIAISQLGYAEVNGGTVYGAWWSDVTKWGDYTYLGWCSMFANWCAYQAGAGMDIAYNKYSAIVGNSFNFLKNNGYADRSFDTVPQPGDFIYFGRGNSFEHVAIVTEYKPDTNEVIFVGGNQGDKVTQGKTKWSASAKWGTQYVLGYGRPNYGQSAPVPTCSCDSYYAGYYACTTSSQPLNIRSGHSTNSAIVGSIPVGAAVHVSKAQGTSNGAWAHVEYNGVTGYASMEYLTRMEDHQQKVHYTDSGKITGAEVTVFDYVAAPGYALTLEEWLPAGKSAEDAVPITISIPDTFFLELTVPLESAGSGSLFLACYPDGRQTLLKETVINGHTISIGIEEDVTLYVVDASKTFPDVDAKFWAKNEIDYMTSRGYINGKLDGSFAPTEAITRRTVALMLYRLAGEPQVSGNCPFEDVDAGIYYNAILWANQSGIVTGYSDGTFRPNSVISRQHFALMLHRYALHRGYLLPAVTDTELSSFSDNGDISKAARDAAQWALSCGLINGRSGGIYDPLGYTSRAQMAVIFCRFLQAVNQADSLE